MPAKAKRAWKMERASVSRKNRSRSRSNKYSRSDSDERPAPHSRDRIWVGGYTRSGQKVSGYYRSAPTG